MRRFASVLLLSWFVLADNAAAAGFADGAAAFEREDYAGAFSQWKPLAEIGNADA